jgi:hypothetical protein
MKTYEEDSIGYNFRITAVKSLAGMIKYMNKDDVSGSIIPLLAKALNDKVPNVQFIVCQMICQNKQYMDKGAFESQLAPKLKDLTRQGNDGDVWYHATMCLHD